VGFPVSRIAQHVVGASARRGEQGVARRHGEPGAAQRLALARRLDEREDVGVGVGEDHQVRALPASGQGVDARRVRGELGEGDRSGRDASRARDGRSARPQPRQVEAHAPRSLLDARSAPQRLVDRVERVRGLEHEARRE